MPAPISYASREFGVDPQQVGDQRRHQREQQPRDGTLGAPVRDLHRDHRARDDADAVTDAVTRGRPVLRELFRGVMLAERCERREPQQRAESDDHRREIDERARGVEAAAEIEIQQAACAGDQRVVENPHDVGPGAEGFVRGQGAVAPADARDEVEDLRGDDQPVCEPAANAQPAIRDHRPRHHEEHEHQRDVAPGAHPLGGGCAAHAAEDDRGEHARIRDAAQDSHARPAIDQ